MVPNGLMVSSGLMVPNGLMVPSGLMVSHGLMFSDGLKVAIHCDRIPSGIGHAPIGLCVKFRTDRKRSAQWTAAVTVSGDLMVSYDV